MMKERFKMTFRQMSKDSEVKLCKVRRVVDSQVIGSRGAIENVAIKLKILTHGFLCVRRVIMCDGGPTVR